MPSDLLQVALSVLASLEQPLPLRAAALEALVSALSEGIRLPSGAIRHIWWFWRAAPTRRALRSAWLIGAIDDPVIRAEAIEILISRNTEHDLRDLAVDILIGDGHRAHVPDQLLGTLVDRVSTESDAREVTRLIDVVHASRGLASDELRAVRDRFASSSTAGTREISIVVDALTIEPDVGFVRRMLADPDVDVRVTVANAIGLDHPGRERCGPLLEDRLAVEVHPRGRAALLRAQANLLEDEEGGGGPVRRRWGRQ